MSSYVAQKATVELTGITTGGSGKAFAKGTGTIDIGFRCDNPIDLPDMFTRQVNFNLVGFFTP